MGKFKADPTDPVASARGWTRRQRRVKEIEQLQTAIATWKEEEIEWKATEAGLLARVEELEEELQRACNQRNIAEAVADCCLEGHYSTVKQIDAAWLIVREFNGAYTATGRWVLRALERLGIKACEGCGGEGITRQDPHGEPLEPCEVCAPFTGHGWVIKDECPDCDGSEVKHE